MSSADAVTVGTELAPVTGHSDLATSVLYAGASGDFNPLHYDPTFAAEVSPTGGVIAHGMYSMGLASRMLTAFAGEPQAVVEISVRFTRPWPLDTSATFTGKVTAIEEGVATVSLAATTEAGDRILRGTGRVRL